MGEGSEGRPHFWLYRPAAVARAQSIQVVHAAAALARRGHPVEVCVQGGRSAADVLDFFGAPGSDALTVHCLPRRSAPASWAYRALFARWLLRTRGRGVVVARSKRHAAAALRWARGRFALIVEAHEVDSLQRADAGDDPGPWRTLEATVLAGACGLVANCEGTLAGLRDVHGARLPPAIVAHNGAAAGRPSRADGAGIGVVGSVRPYKDPLTVARAAARTADRICWVGPARGELDALQQLAEGRLGWEPPLAPAQVAARLRRFRVLLLPLSAGRFGEALTSPLKLWDALQSGVPLVAADTPAVRAAAEGAYVPYRPGDADSLRSALDAAARDPDLRARVRQAARARARTWDDRAAEVEAFVARVAP